MSVGKRIHRAMSLLLACWMAPLAVAAQEATIAQPATVAQQISQRLSFVRSFSSADDVREPLHPVLDRTIDIIAGPKDFVPRIDALRSPAGLTTDSNDRVFIADSGAKAVHTFDFVHSKYSLLEKGGDRLRIPIALAVDGQDNLYVVDDSSRTILVYDSAGKFRRSLGRLSGGESYFESPAAIAIDVTTGRVYVCDSHRHMVIIMDDHGRVMSTVGKRGGGDRTGEFRLPSQVVVNGGEVFVLDAGNTRIQILDTAGHFLRTINLAYADHRTGLAVDKQGNAYVSDPVLNQIQVFSREGRRLATFDPSAAGAANFSHPSAMWITAGDCLYVVDSQSNRVSLFQIRWENAKQCR